MIIIPVWLTNKLKFEEMEKVGSNKGISKIKDLGFEPMFV